ncbi:MAG: hypothetical protein AAGK04_03030 [Planctomycetota bacterium]
MSGLLNWLFGTEDIRFGAENVALDWAHPMPAWVWVLLGGGLSALAIWTYVRLVAPRAPRVVLASLRVLLLLTVLALIAGPQLVRKNERIERDRVLVLADRSASMSIADVDASAGARSTRERQLTEGVRAAWPALSALGREREVVWLGFDAGAFDLAPTNADTTGSGGGVSLGEADGRTTRLGKAIEQALRRAAAKPVSGLVVFSDGRSLDAIDKATARRLQAERIPVHVYPLGSAAPIADLAVARVEAPSLAFVGDIVPISVRLERVGGDPEAPPERVRVELIDRATGLVLDEQDATIGGADDNSGELTLTHRPSDEGARDWAVRLARRAGPPDLIPANDERPVAVELIDRPLRVVYIDGYPRWEYRYLKNLLLRESSIVSSALLLATNRRYLQEGDVVLDRLPTSPEEWADVDVVVLGDVRPDVFGEAQLRQLRSHVSDRGAGLLWIAGASSTPGAWAGTPLGDLLPFTGAGDRAGVSAWRDPVTMAPTDQAMRQGLLRLGESRDGGAPSGRGDWPERLSDPATGWSRLMWAQRLERSRLKPTAETLAVALAPERGGPGAEASNEDPPLVLSMRYGAGSVLYVATDEIWRWRYARGEALPERFWVPLIRFLGRESLGRSGRAASLEVSPKQPAVDQPVRVAVRLLDQSLLDIAPERLRVRLTPRNPGDGAPIELVLPREARPASPSGEAPAMATFATTWLPDRPGSYLAAADDPLLAGIGLETDVRVRSDDDELRRPEADHAYLERLAESTGGRVLSRADLTRLSDLLPNRQRRIESAPDVDPLWDTPAVLLWLISLLTLEWIGRRLVRLS